MWQPFTYSYLYKSLTQGLQANASEAAGFHPDQCYGARVACHIMHGLGSSCSIGVHVSLYLGCLYASHHVHGDIRATGPLWHGLFSACHACRSCCSCCCCRRLLGIQMQGEAGMQHLISIHFSWPQLGRALLQSGRRGMLYFVFNSQVVAVLVAHNIQEGEFVAQVREGVGVGAARSRGRGGGGLCWIQRFSNLPNCVFAGGGETPHGEWVEGSRGSAGAHGLHP